ncbi:MULTISPECIES: ComEA family DNA-binding protein [Pseudomonadati]|uniref:Helix-hairpin-helix domain-containing protein n=1 Tax=Shewanella aestuarii TaxID=1028752 RepID=A0ABT0L3D2_9GAMM|nr:helix-hairpin-helix domain-containing protein [Shewanella aestuarii]MCL1118114.1 helix-hairpin-helix domain-containing protein [Shewanella aestuarii]GGN81768.1 competence protein ComEA [Shewanella aestuarii]
MKLSPFSICAVMAIGLMSFVHTNLYAAQETQVKQVSPKAMETTSDITSKVNINKADLAELQSLKGIGEAKAKSIIEYRNKNGQFKDVKQLMEVSGIGEKLLEQNADRLEI